LKDIELKLISELMKNSRRSDRDLAKVTGVSQPTVTRTRQRLEKERIIKEYTMIPDFQKLGYHIMAIIFLKLKSLSSKEREELYSESRKMEKENPRTLLLVMEGMGIGEDMVEILFFRDYSEYADYLRTVREAAAKFLDRLEGTTELLGMAESGSWNKITIHTDGGCDGNPGPGGWAALLRYGDHVRELTGGEPATTNNRMELQAAISALLEQSNPNPLALR